MADPSRGSVTPDFLFIRLRERDLFMTDLTYDAEWRGIRDLLPEISMDNN